MDIRGIRMVSMVVRFIRLSSFLDDGIMIPRAHGFVNRLGAIIWIRSFYIWL